MGAIWVIAANTFREVVRQRLFVLILVITVAALAIMLIFPFFTFREDTEMFKDLALSTITLSTVFLVALTASSAVAEELESRTATTVLAKPVARWQFLMGKYVGVVLALAAAMAILAIVLFLTAYLRVYLDALPRERHLAFSFSQSEAARTFQALMLHHALATLPGCAMILFQGAVLAAVAVVLSSRFSRVLAVIVTFGLFLAGHLLEFVQIALQPAAPWVRNSLGWLLALLPFLETFNITGKLSHTPLDPAKPEWAAVWTYTALAGLYALGYVALVLVVGATLLRRREID